MKLRGVAHIRDVALKWSTTHRCAKRRLKKMDARIVEDLLVQFCPGGDWFVDISVLKKYLPGLANDDEEDPSIATLREILDVKEMVREVLERVA